MQIEKYVIWGAGIRGSRLQRSLGDERVVAYIDRNSEKWGTSYLGKTVIGFEEYKRDYATYKIVVSCEQEDEVKVTLKENHIQEFFLFSECPSEFQQPAYGDRLEKFVKAYLKKEQEYVVYGDTVYANVLKEWIGELQNRNPQHAKNQEELKQLLLDGKELLLAKRVDNKKELDRLGCKVTDLFDCSDRIKEYHNPEIEALHNTHKGERCFIVATGPSLRFEDLETLRRNKEICFSMNSIYEAFGETRWRPDYFLVDDCSMLRDESIDWDAIDVPNKMMGDTSEEFWNKKKHDKYLKYHQIYEMCQDRLPHFTDDFSTRTYLGYTVTYTCIQLAAYMGFSKIYLLGVDFSYANERNATYGHFYKEEKKEAVGYTKEVLNAYKATRKYADEHGIQVINATRGGKLEVFERVDFDSLF